MKQNNPIVITKKEMLRLIGIKRVTLAALENAAGIPESANRMGYTSGELKSLKTALRKIVEHKTLF